MAPTLRRLHLFGFDVANLDVEPHFGSLDAVLMAMTTLESLHVPWRLLGAEAFDCLTRDVIELGLEGFRGQPNLGKRLGKCRSRARIYST